MLFLTTFPYTDKKVVSTIAVESFEVIRYMAKTGLKSMTVVFCHSKLSFSRKQRNEIE